MKRLASKMRISACQGEGPVIISYLRLTENTSDESKYAGMAQSVERRIGSAEVPGPIPGAS